MDNYKSEDELFKLKTRIRRQYLAQQISSEQVEDALILKNLLNYFSKLETTATILTYVNMGNEFNSIKFINELYKIKPGLNVFAPRVTSSASEGAQMEFYQLDFINSEIALELLETSNYGILEPSGSESKFDPKQSLDNVYVLMPGVVFDHYGNRIGHGAGYYDNYLRRLGPVATKIAPVRNNQKYRGELPTTSNDMKIDVIVDYKGIHYLGH